jgi:hypothetical protein
LRVRRPKPYVCVDCDFADHFRFQETKDLEAAAGTWLRCLAYSRAQEQDGVVKATWLRRTFSRTYERVEELVAVGLLRLREDGDYELHAYAPRNQTRAMLAESRETTRQRVATWRERAASDRDGEPEHASSDDVTRYSGVTSDVVTRDEDGVGDAVVRDMGEQLPIREAEGVSTGHSEDGSPPSMALSSSSSSGGVKTDRETRIPRSDEDIGTAFEAPSSEAGAAVTRYKAVTRGKKEADKTRCNAFVPTSTSLSTSSSSSSSSDLHNVTEIQSSHEGGVQRGGASGTPSVDATAARRPLPPSERGLSGPAWLAAFTDGIASVTGRPCTAPRMYLGTLERIVTHHAPARDAASACRWLRDEAKAFARKWDGQHPPKGLTPDGLERWLNEGRQGPPQFGRERIVQLPAEEWHADDFSEFGAEVVK